MKPPKALGPPWPRPKVYIPRFLYFVLSVVFLGDVALTGRAFLLRDIVTFFHPWQHAVSESLRSGHLPFWSHDTFCGIPLLANLQSGVFYPLNWLYTLLPFDWALTFGMVVHLTIAGVLMRGFLKRVGLRNLSAFLGGALFAYGTWTISYLEFPMKLGSAVWLPLLWSGLWESIRQGRRRGLAFGSIAIALSFLAGYPQLTFYGLLSGGIWAVFLTVTMLRDNTVRGRDRFARVFALPVIVACGVAAAAIQLAPASDMAALSSKAAPYDAAVGLTRSLPPRMLLGAIDPFLFGFPGIDRYWGGEIVEYAYGTFYVGALAFVLVFGAGPAFFFPRNRRARRELTSKVPKRTVIPRVVPWFLAVGAVVGLVISLGRFTPIYPWLFEHAPGFDRTRWPATACYLVAVHCAALAGVGLQTILAEHRRVRAASLASIALGALLILVWILASGPLSGAFRAFQTANAPEWQLGAYETSRGAWLSMVVLRGTMLLAAGAIGLTLFEIRSRAAIAWIVLILVDLFLVRRALDFPSERGFYDEESASIVELRESLGGHRIFTPRSTDQLGNFLYGSTNHTAFEWAREAMLCNANLPYHIAQAHGCEPLSPRRHDAFVQAFDSEGTPWEIKERIFDLWDASLLLTVEGVPPSRVPSIGTPREGIVHNPHEPRLGRAMIVTGWETFDDGESLLGKLLSERHDPRQWTLLEAGPGDAASAPSTRSPSQAGESVLYEAGPNSVSVAWHLGHAGMLRVLESWAPGWEATVNGAPVAIHRADFLFMAVPVPAGSCEVHFTYRPPSFPLGLTVSVVALVIIAACWFTDRRPPPDIPGHSPNLIDSREIPHRR